MTPAQIALARLLARKPWIVPIPGTAKLHRLEENGSAAAIVHSATEAGDIGEAAAKIPLVRARYAEAQQLMIDR